MLDDLKQHVLSANLLLPEYGLAPFTWGNASGVDREREVIVIKPSGVPYPELTPDMMVVVGFDGQVVEGNLNPSSDTPTHIELYKAFPDIAGVVHTHSKYATAFAQAGRGIPAYGTTHADFAFGAVPCADELTAAEVNTEYEKNTGLVIVRKFRTEDIDENAVPGVLVKSHGVFTWGKNPESAAQNAATLEIIAEIALNTEILNPGIRPIRQYLLDKHYLRKHGKNAYYGQK
ncbi:MAG: L-ribulose-5-phosphate 4-epimerase [Clostridia bacterium]|nr:L-ribulose-5-phosphate 4-epimerase [Clostridia bacterium]